MHSKWNHSIGQPGLSQAIISGTRVTGPARLPGACLNLVYNLALTGISLTDRPLSVTYEGKVFLDFFEQWLLLY